MARSKAITVNGMRTCAKCPNVFPLDQYRVARRMQDGTVYRHGTCRPCEAKYHSSYEWSGLAKLQAEKKRLITELKSKPCVDCNQSFPPYVMDFDHVRGQKYKGITKLVAQTHSVETLLEEVAKCDLVCANCHRIRTHADGITHRQRIIDGRKKAGLPCFS